MSRAALKLALLDAGTDMFCVERQMEAAVRTRFAVDPSAFSASAATALGSVAANRQRLGQLGLLDRHAPATLAGVLTTRVPAIRDKISQAHPLVGDWVAGPPWPPSPDALTADLPPPSGLADIRLVALKRWHYLLSVDADSRKLLVGDLAYDADLSTEDLLDRCHQITLTGLIELLAAFERIDPALLAAFWRRDVRAAATLLDRYQTEVAAITPATLLPSMGRTEPPGDTRERVKAAFGVIWEYERGSELLRALLAPGWLDEAEIASQLGSSRALWTAFHDDTRFSRLAVDGWLWEYALDELAENGPAAYHARSPYRTYALSGDPTRTHQHMGHVQIRGFETLDEVFHKTPPALLDRTLQRIDNLALAHFFWGWSGIDVAFALPLLISRSLPSRSGRREGSKNGDELSVQARSAFGRLSMVLLANICPTAAEAQMWAANRSPKVHELGSLISSERRWPKKPGPDKPQQRKSVQSRSIALGQNIFANPVRDALKGLNAVLPAHPQLGWSCGFDWRAWWSDQGERQALHDAFQQHRPGNRYDLGKLFAERSGPLYDVALTVASDELAGLTPMAQDPVHRIRRNEWLARKSAAARLATIKAETAAPPDSSMRPLHDHAQRVEEHRINPNVVANKARHNEKKKQKARAAKLIIKRAKRRQRL